MEKRMALLAVVFTAFCVCSSPVLAMSLMGPPRAIFGEDRWVLGFEYAHQEVDLQTYGRVHENLGLGWMAPDYAKYKIKGLESDMFMASLGYGIGDYWDVYARLGMADASDDIVEKMANGNTGDQFSGFDSSFGSTFGIGTRTTFCEIGDLTWGAVCQVTWTNPDSSVDLEGDPNFSGDIELDFWEVQIAVGPTLQLDGLRLYGGPFLHFAEGDLHMYGRTVDAFGITQRVKAAHEIEEESQLGGYLGAQWQAAKNASWYAEYQFTGDAWAGGIGVIWKFR